MKLIQGLDAALVREGFLVRGEDFNDYKAKNGKWVMISKHRVIYHETDKKNRFIAEIRSPPKKHVTVEVVTYTCLPESDDDLPEPESEPKKNRGRPRKEKRCTREPTKYNLFVRDEMVNVKRQYPSLSNNERLKICSQRWKQQSS